MREWEPENQTVVDADITRMHTRIVDFMYGEIRRMQAGKFPVSVGETVESAQSSSVRACSQPGAKSKLDKERIELEEAGRTKIKLEPVPQSPNF